MYNVFTKICSKRNLPDQITWNSNSSRASKTKDIPKKTSKNGDEARKIKSTYFPSIEKKADSMQEKFQSLTLALDYIGTPTTPTISKRAPKKPQEISKEARRLLLANKNKVGKNGARDIKFHSFTRRTNLHVSKVSDKGKDHEKSHQIRRMELQKYLEKIAQKNHQKHKEQDYRQDEALFSKSDNKKTTGLQLDLPPTRHHKLHVEKLMRKEIHSLPLITEMQPAPLIQSPRRSRTYIGAKHKHEHDTLPSRLTSYGLSCLQDRVYKIDTTFRHAPYLYHSSSYGHPYVTDELFERISDWIRTVNISVDWSSVVQSVSDDIVSIEDEMSRGMTDVSRDLTSESRDVTSLSHDTSVVKVTVEECSKRPAKAGKPQTYGNCSR